MPILIFCHDTFRCSELLLGICWPSSRMWTDVHSNHYLYALYIINHSMLLFETTNIKIEIVVDNAKGRKLSASDRAPQLPALCPFNSKLNRSDRPICEKGKCRWTSGLYGSLRGTTTAKSECSAPLPRIPPRGSDPSLPPRKPSRTTSNQNLALADTVSRSHSSSQLVVDLLSEALYISDKTNFESYDSSHMTIKRLPYL
jgi:hypothetical protein